MIPIQELRPKDRMRRSVSIDDAAQDVAVNPVPLIIVDLAKPEGAL